MSKLNVCLCGVLGFVLAGTAGTFTFTHPKSDVAPVLNEASKTFLSLPTEKLDAHLRDKENFRTFNKAGTRPLRTRFAWTYAPAPDEPAPKRYIATLRRCADGLIVYKEMVSKPEATVFNLEIASDYVFRVAVCGDRGKELFPADRPFRTEDTPPRVLYVKGVHNIRDLGGWVGADGRRVRQGLVYRSQGFNDNADYAKRDKSAGGKAEKPKAEWTPGRPRGNPESRRQCRASLGIKTELDLRRSENECWRMTDSPLGTSVDWQLIPSSSYGGLDSPSARMAFARDFRTFLRRDNYPIVFHCIGGADRTGSLAYILNGLLGVSEADLDHDYHFTAACMGHPWPTDKKKGTCRLDGLKSVFAKYPGETVNARIHAYASACGIKEREIETFRSIMLEEVKDSGAAVLQTNRVENAYARFLAAPSSTRRALMRDDAFRDALKATDGKWSGEGVGVPRWYKTARNLRDLGGWRARGGARIRFGRLFRSAQIDDPKVRTALVQRFGIRTDLDLRTKEEARPTADLPAVVVVANNYGATVKDPKWLRAAFDVLLDETKYPIIFHCAKGADRTGTLAALIELLMGVDEDDVAKDWQLTAVYNRNPLFESVRYDDLMTELAELPGDTWCAKAEAWVRKAGVTDDEIARLRALLLEEPVITFGLVSDTHVCGPDSVRFRKGVAGADFRLREAFRWMSAAGVDAVVNVGDVTELGTVEEVELYRKCFGKEFPEGRCRDGIRPVEQFVVWGNHDCHDASYMRKEPAVFAVTNAAEHIVGNYERLSQEINGISFGKGGFAKLIHGVWFGGANWGNEAVGATVVDRIAEAAGPSNVCFFVQHSPAVTQEEKEALARHPNCIRFSGHAHVSLASPNALAVTNGLVTIAASSTSASAKGAYAAIVRVWRDRVTVERRDVKNGGPLGEEWTIPRHATPDD